MADPKMDPKDAKISRLQAEVARLKVAKAGRGTGGELAPEHKGTKTYVVGPSKHYRDGRIFQAGELVTVTDERPAVDWILAAEQRGAAPKPPPAGGRASDKTVG